MPDVSGTRPARSGAAAESVLEAVLERVTYANEETGRLDRLQRPAESLGSGEPEQPSDQRPHRADRQPEQPPRCLRQARHQRDAGD
jgi:hypothetical protein